ncbi:MAG: Thiamine-monophosphate kinase [Candidatus Fermentimicrarchaeum limneticum]|uniref:Thiamine-monophosphate kinase n=1 Tax=Fermentimicrarchaeum limneticum TaxID=2795018 RepID=A0A7D6BQ02_FERL1|nr:MAG: Thiamine-monophosphate kinase [Candidatus Fermentimicrarchaeum limneticum]
MRAGELGERRLIELLVRGLYRNSRVVAGAGEDDAALLSFGDRQLVAASDIMFASTHFPTGMKPEHIGRKVAVANLSDLAAMGAFPVAMLFSFGIPTVFEVAELRGIIKGINAACSEYDAPFVGGDTKKARELTICGVALGEVRKGGALTRCNAKAGDVVAVTGEIGNAALGLKILLERMKTAGYSKLTNAFLLPRARIEEGRAIAECRVSAAGMDITDGLLFSAGEIARMSGVCLSLEKDRIPISEEARKFARKYGISEDFLLNNGEDYELLVTVRKNKFSQVRRKVETIGGSLVKIGHVVEGRGVLLDGRKLKITGYDSLKSRQP